MATHTVKTTYSLEALDRLQRSLGLTPRSAGRWAAAARRERQERSWKRETRGR